MEIQGDMTEEQGRKLQAEQDSKDVALEKKMEAYSNHLPILEYFTFTHLPPHLGAYSRVCAEVAVEICEHLPITAEMSAGLRKLLEAKDCFVRARVSYERTLREKAETDSA